MDIRKEDISKMRLRVGICNNEIINAQTELVISHIKKVHKDVSFTKFDIGGGRHFNTSGIAGVPENVLCNMNDVVPWSVAVSDAISAGYIDAGVTGLNELFANDMSEILKQGVTLSAITKRRDTRAVLITKKKRRSADTDNKVKLYTDNYDKLKRCRYIYDNTSCQLLDTIEDCIDMLMENECDGVFAGSDNIRMLRLNHIRGCDYNYVENNIYIPDTGEAVSAILTADDEEICSIIGKASDEQTIKIIDIESALIGRIKSYGMVDDAKVIVSFNGKNAVIAANIYRGDKSFRCEVKGEDVYIERMMDKLVRQILHKLA